MKSAFFKCTRKKKSRRKRHFPYEAKHLKDTGGKFKSPAGYALLFLKIPSLCDRSIKKLRARPRKGHYA